MRHLLPLVAAGLLLLVPALARAEDDEKPVKEADVPKAAVDAVQKKYPGSKVTAWTREEENKVTTYEAKVEATSKGKDGKDTTRKVEVTLSVEGKILAEEEEIAQDALPDAVKKALAASKYAKAKVTHVARIVHEEKADDASYEVTVLLDGKKVDVTFDKAGKITEEEADEDAKPEEPPMK